MYRNPMSALTHGEEKSNSLRVGSRGGRQTGKRQGSGRGGRQTGKRQDSGSFGIDACLYHMDT